MPITEVSSASNELSPILTGFILFLTITSSFIFSGMEVGMIAINPLKLHRNARMGKKTSQRMLHYLENPEMFLWITLIVGTTANFISVCIVTLYSYQWFENKLLFSAAIIGGLLSIYLLGDWLPKMIFRRKPMFCCTLVLPLFRITYLIFYPIVKVSVWLVSLIFWKRNNTSYSKRLISNRIEMRDLMKNITPDITLEEQAMIEHVMNFFDTTVQQLIVPMEKVVCLSSNATIKEAKEISRTTQRTRIPVYQIYADGEKRITGILLLKTVLYEDAEETRFVTDFTRPPIFLHPNAHLQEALSKMQSKGQRIAVVMDENSQELGIVTLQDILAAIFGKMKL